MSGASSVRNVLRKSGHHLQCRLLVRQLATASSSSSNPAGEASSSSSGSPTSWTPPIPPGKEPAFDEALAYLSSYQAKQRSQAHQLQKKLNSIQDAEQKAQLQTKIEQLEIAADVNDPQTRWEFLQGKSELSRIGSRLGTCSLTQSVCQSRYEPPSASSFTRASLASTFRRDFILSSIEHDLFTCLVRSTRAAH